MIQLELQYNTGTEIVNVPTSWADITFSQYVELLKVEKESDLLFEDRLANRFKIFLGIDKENFKSLKAFAIEQISTMLMFSFNFEELNEYYIVPEEFKNFDVGDQEWQKLIECQIAMKPIYVSYPITPEMSAEEKEEIGIKILMEMYEIGHIFVKAFTGKDISNEKLTDVYWMPAFFLTKYYNFFLSSGMMMGMMQESSVISTKD